MLVSDLCPFGHARFDQDPDLVCRQKADHLLTDFLRDLAGICCYQRSTARSGALVYVG